MLAWNGNRFLILLLGLWVALAPAIYAAPATAMATQTTMSDDARPGGCDGCPEGDMERSLCELMCLHAGQIAIAVEPGKLTNDLGTQIDRKHLRAMQGVRPIPDPAPPKPVSLL